MKVKHYSPSFIDEVCDAYEAGDLSQRKLAEHYGIGYRTLQRWLGKRKLADHYDDIVPAGQTLRGVSTLYKTNPKTGKTTSILEWVKTNAAAEDARKILLETAAALGSDLPRAKTVPAPAKTEEDLASVYIVTDYHFGMMSWFGETGEEWDLEIAERTLLDWFTRAIRSAPKSEVGVLAQLGDFLHYDSLKQVTPSSGHVLDTDAKYAQMVHVVIRVLRQIILMMLKKHKHVHVILAEGNHDLASSVWLRALFAEKYADEDRVTVDSTEIPYYCFEWGDTALFFHHGHCKRMGDLSKVFAAEYRQVYGRTKFNYAHMGHYHHIASKEDGLMVVEQHPTLAAKDSYSSRGGYHSYRSASVITYSKSDGEVARSVLRPITFNGERFKDGRTA